MTTRQLWLRAARLLGPTLAAGVIGFGLGFALQLATRQMGWAVLGAASGVVFAGFWVAMRGPR